MNVKKQKKIPIVVCEFHQEVLEFIHRYIAKKILPYQRIKMIHFDSHPDLAFPNHLSADDCYSKEKMYNDLDIADWILPLCYADGHLNSLVWVKPPWAKQIDDLTTTMNVGKHIETGKLRVSCREDYFLEDGIYCQEHEMENTKKLNLTVCRIEDLVRACDRKYCTNNKFGNYKDTKIPSEMVESNSSSFQFVSKGDPNCVDSINTLKSLISIPDQNSSLHGYQTELTKTKECIHDQVICKKIKLDPQANNAIDVRSITDPHASEKVMPSTTTGTLPSGVLETFVTDEILPSLTEHYILDIDLDYFSVTNPFLQDYTKEEYRRLKKIYKISFPKNKLNEETLSAIVQTAQKKVEYLESQIKSFATGHYEVSVENSDLIGLLKSIQERKDEENIDWDMVHNAGLTTDLPHHVSTNQEISQLVDKMITLIKKLPPPAVVTIARSTLDEYCPPSQVDMIEKKVLDALKNVFEHVDVILDYKDTSRLL